MAGTVRDSWLSRHGHSTRLPAAAARNQHPPPARSPTCRQLQGCLEVQLRRRLLLPHRFVQLQQELRVLQAAWGIMHEQPLNTSACPAPASESGGL
jgi:hypothetical protein